MPSRSLVHHLQDLQSHRTHPDRAREITSDLAMLRSEIEKRNKSLGGVGDAWAQVVPKDLAHAAEFSGITRGVLSIRVRDAAKRHALDRFLRSGGLEQLIRACPVSLTRVKFVR